ncbi:MAG: hypothetical protein CMH58_03775 [Myxococcales bacterium]|nr:hypothetical protein [Myxococcales bacterium]
MKKIIILGGLFSTICTCDLRGLPEGLAPTPAGEGASVIFNLDASPLPEIPFPNDLATRIDPTSPTGRRLNITKEAPTEVEREVREKADLLDGFGTYSPISVAFDRPLDLCEIVTRHHGEDDFTNDAVYVVDLETGEPALLDLNRGFFPYLLPGRNNGDAPDQVTNRYYGNDPRAQASTIVFDDHPEAPGEDSDGDGVQDTRFDLPDCDGAHWRYPENTIWEAETNTLLIRPIRPLQPGKTYAVLLTNRLKDMNGHGVRSPFPWINHPRQTAALKSLEGHLDNLGITLSELSFAWTFTTQSGRDDLKVIRAGMYGSGPLKALHDAFPPDLQSLHAFFTDPVTAGSPFDAQPHLASGAHIARVVSEVNQTEQLIEEGSAGRSLLASMENISHFISGSFISPNFLVDKDGLAAEGCATPLPPHGNRSPATKDCEVPHDDDENFVVDRHSGEMVVGEGRVTFWCAIPQARFKRPGDAAFPVSIYGHGYGSTRFEMLGFAGFHARFGIATCSTDVFGHGLAIPPALLGVLNRITEDVHAEGLLAALTDGRARDLNNDGEKDSGGDYWTADTFHTRDVVRQSVVDWMHFIRLLRSFDGQRQMSVSILNPDGSEGHLDGLAGDFDGDGSIDIGGPDSEYYAWGQSMGGIISGSFAGVEQALTAAAPTAGAGGLLDVGVRSIQGGVKEAVHLRFMAVLLEGVPHRDDLTRLRFWVPNVNDDERVEVAEVAGIVAGDRIRISNLANGEADEVVARDQGDGRVIFRAHVGADAMRAVDRRKVFELDPGPSGLVEPYVLNDDNFPEGLTLETLGDPLKIEIIGADGTLKQTIDAFGPLTDANGATLALRSSFQGLIYDNGLSLHAPGRGLGKYRSTPDYRRFVAISQTILDPADPINFAPLYLGEPVDYDDATPGTAVMVIPTAGDMNVPVNTAFAMATAAGILPLTEAEAPAAYAHYGRSPAQAAADAFALEAVVRKRRWTQGDRGARPVWTAESNPGGIQFDVDDLDMRRDRFHAPDFEELGVLCKGDTSHPSCRYAWSCGDANNPCKPLREFTGQLLADGRTSALRVPMLNVEGQHGFLYPEPDRRLNGGFDTYGFMVNLIGDFFASGGKSLRQEVCMNVIPATIVSTCTYPLTCEADGSPCDSPGPEGCGEGNACLQADEGICATGASASETPVTCRNDETCALSFPYGVLDPNDPAQTPVGADQDSIDNHVCEWIKSLGASE